MEDISTNPVPLHKPSSRAIRGVEIFKSGKHNGDTYTDRDLDDMVEAFKVLKEKDFTPALKLGHTKDKPGNPAYGWVENLRRVGKTLVADFVGLHESVFKAIKERMYDRCSAEIYFDLKRSGQIFRRALKAVALLGAEVPAVAGLKPLHKMEFAAMNDFRSVSVSEGAFKQHTEEDPGREIDRRARELIEAGEAQDYAVAVDDVLAADPALARAYVTASGTLAQAPMANDAGKELDEKAKERVREGRSRDYIEAVDTVLAADADLARRYEQERWAK